MSAGVYSQAKLTNYDSQVRQWRERRRALWSAAVDRLIEMVLEAERCEAEIQRGASFIGEARNRREGSTQYLRVRFEIHDAEEPIGRAVKRLYGPYTERLRKSDYHVVERLGLPPMRTVERLGADDARKSLRQAVTDIKQASRRRERLIEAIQRIAQVAIQQLPEPSEHGFGLARNIPGSLPQGMGERIQAAMLGRRARIESVVHRLDGCFARMEELDETLDGLMHEFNARGTYNRNLISRWRLPRRDQAGRSMGGVAGPYWYQVFKNSERRHLKPVHGTLTRDKLRAARQERRAEELLRLARAIESRRDERRALIAGLNRIGQLTEVTKRETRS